MFKARKLSQILGGAATTPINTVAPAISGTTTQGSTVTCSQGTWLNTPTSYAYQWKRNGVTIAGATSSSYLLAVADVGQSVLCTVTATNAVGSGTADSNTITPTSSATLGTLAFSATTFTIGTPSSGTITGATPGSTIAATGLPTGLTIDGAARTWTWDGTGTASTGSFTLTETLAGATGSPKSTVIGYTISASSGALGGTGTLSAPTLGYPSPVASNPTSIPIHIPVDYISGNKIKLAYGSALPMTTANTTILTHTLTDTDITNGSFSFPLPTFSGITYFTAFGNDGTNDSQYLSNIVSWGDTTAPTITTSATQSNLETQPLAVALTATDTGGVASWAIVGGPDQLEFQIVGSTLEWINNGSQNYSSPQDQALSNTYKVTVQATDYGGNSSTLAITVTVSQADLTPDAFSWTNNTGAVPSTVYTAANTWTISGLSPGINAPVSVTGGLISKNGGAYSSSSTTVQNGDTLNARGTSSSSYSTAVNVAVTVGTLTATYTITTEADPSAAGFTASANQPTEITNSYSSGVWTFSGIDFVVGGKPVVYCFFQDTTPVVTSVVVKGAGASGADIALTQRAATSSGSVMQVWTSDTAIVTGSSQQVVVTSSVNASYLNLMCGTLTNVSSSVPTATGVTNFASIASPVTTPAVTIPVSGIGVAFWALNGATPYSTSSGTLILTDSNTLDQGATTGAITRQLTAGSWVPSIAYTGGQAATGGIALTWNH